jgi:hypothetical protein
MSIVPALLAPLLMLLPGAVIEPRAEPASQSEVIGDGKLSEGVGHSFQPAERLSLDALRNAFRVEPQAQVRIEQRVTIRIIPRPLAPSAGLLLDLPNNEIGTRYSERRMGKCVPVSGIAGVQVDKERLILFMRDRGMISAELERACRPHNFYSGFYLDRSGDGQLCIKRDKLHSRAGASCTLTMLHKLVAVDE